MSGQKSEAKRIFCNNCMGETHHVLRGKYSRPRKVALSEDPADVFAVRNSQDYEVHDFARITTAIWSCAGCEEETFEWEYVEIDPNGGQLRRYFPERLPEPEDGPLPHRTFQKLDADLERLYREVITSFNNDCLLLCTLGLRVLLEAICAEKGVLGGNLDQKIQALARFVPNESLLPALHAFRFAENAAAHELEALDQCDARTAIGVMEGLLDYLYELDYKASKMRYYDGRLAPKKQPLRPTKGGYVH